MNRTYHVGLIIKELISEKKLSASIIAQRMGVNRQNVYNAMNKHTMTIEELEIYAKAFDMDIVEIESRIEVLNKPVFKDIDYLKEIFEKAENVFREINEQQCKRIVNLEDQLRNKEKQINSLIGLLERADQT